MTLLTINPTDSSHDAREAGGTVTVTGNPFVTSGLHWLGLLLPSVALPAAATLVSSTLYYKSVDSARQSPNLVWYVQAADNPSGYTATASDISGRPRGTASVSDVASNIGTTTYRAVDITALVAEAHARPGWASGNNIALIGDAQAGSLEIGGYDTGANIWYVEINYSVASESGPGAGLRLPGLLTVSAGGAGLQQVRI